MKTSVDSFVTIKEKLFAFLFQFHVVGKSNALYVLEVWHVRTRQGAAMCVVVLQLIVRVGVFCWDKSFEDNLIWFSFIFI